MKHSMTMFLRRSSSLVLRHSNWETRNCKRPHMINRCQRRIYKRSDQPKKNKDKQETARLTLRERRFETQKMTRTAIKQDRNSGQLFRPSWDSSALCNEDMSTHINLDLCTLGLSLRLQIFTTQCWWVRAKKDKAVVHCCDPARSVLIMSGVSKRLSCDISLTVYCLSL